MGNEEQGFLDSGFMAMLLYTLDSEHHWKEEVSYTFSVITCALSRAITNVMVTFTQHAKFASFNFN